MLSDPRQKVSVRLGLFVVAEDEDVVVAVGDFQHLDLEHRDVVGGHALGERHGHDQRALWLPLGDQPLQRSGGREAECGAIVARGEFELRSRSDRFRLEIGQTPSRPEGQGEGEGHGSDF